MAESKIKYPTTVADIQFYKDSVSGNANRTLNIAANSRTLVMTTNHYGGNGMYFLYSDGGGSCYKEAIVDNSHVQLDLNENRKVKIVNNTGADCLLMFIILKGSVSR